MSFTAVKFVTLMLTAAKLCVSVEHNVGIGHISLSAERSANIWTAYGVNSTGTEIRVPATVPGGIYSDLEDAGIFANKIYHEYNDMDTRWVGRMNWTFGRNFTINATLLLKEKVVLVCEGLDTVSEVFINNISVGKSENMFVRYIFDIKSALRVGENSILVAFQSPVNYAQQKFNEHIQKYGYPVLPASLVPEFRGENDAQMIRKMQSSFGWDWGPSYPNSGIWRDMHVEAYNGAVIRDVMIFSTPSKPVPDETSNTQWSVTARIYYDSGLDDPAVIMTFHRVGFPGVTKTVALEKGEGKSVDISLTESGLNTKLWWPNGYGDQKLYLYDISMASSNQEEISGRVLRFGFRVVKLIEDLVNVTNPAFGRHFYFAVNGVKMYSKGSNMIPLHVLPERVTSSQTEWLLRSAKMSHQNMIRIWGGGIYESEELFNWADEYGILLWADFMFACAMYPATDEFRANVRLEVETQVKRLQYRTSLAMWAGNNENEAALRGNWYGTSSNFSLYRYDYVKLYIGTIRDEVGQLDPSRDFISSSPTNGIKSQEEGWVARNPYDLKYGDLHFYNYNADSWDWKTFSRTRFASEYGYQSFPHFETLAEVADNISTWTWNSPMLDHRQRHPRGQREIRELIRRYFPFPENYDSPEALPFMLYMAQVSQSMGQKTQTEFYRRLQDKLYPDGTGHNMGAMYWQLNDIWQGCSWASVEVSGRWKMQMYFATKFLAPVLASPYKNVDGDVVVELISDARMEIGGSLVVKIFRMSSLTPVFEQRVAVQSEFLTSREVLRISESTLEGLHCAASPTSSSGDPCIVYVSLAGTPDNFLFLQYPTNKSAMRDPVLQIVNVSQIGDGKTIQFTLKTEAVAPFVFLTVRGDSRGYFSDNGFVLTSSSKELTYYSENGITQQQFLDRLKVMSLFDVTAVAAGHPLTPRVYRVVYLPQESESSSYENSISRIFG